MSKKIGILTGMVGVVIIALMIIPNLVSATSNEQRIGGYNPDPGDPLYANAVAIDAIGNTVVAVYSHDRQQGGPNNIYMVTSTDGGANWGGTRLVCGDNNNNQYNPDVVLVDIEGYGIIAFIVWKQNAYILASAIILSNSNYWDPFAAQTKEVGYGSVNYPRVEGKDYNTQVEEEQGPYTYVFFVWEANVGQGAQNGDEIQMRAFLWESVGDESSQWGNILVVASDRFDYDLNHPSIDYAISVELTYDCSDPGTGDRDVRHKQLWFPFPNLDPDTFNMGIGDQIFPTQSDYYFPDITTRWDDRTIIVGQRSNDGYYIIARSYQFGYSWDTAIDCGANTATPSLRGVAVDNQEPDATNFPGGINVIWSSTSEVRSRQLHVVSDQITVYGTSYNTDTTGFYEGGIFCVDLSLSRVGNADICHNIYINSPGAVIYYTNP